MQNKKLPKLPNSDYVCINFGHSNTMQTDITSWLHFTIANITAFSLTLICNLSISSAQFSSVAQSCPTLCNPMNHSTPGLPVHHQLPEFSQTHVHQVRDAIQPSHPRSSSFPSAPNPSRHQSLFQ